MLLVLLPVAAAAGPVEDWHEAPDAALVIVLLDGFSRELLFGEDLDGAALMPLTRDWASGSRDFSEVLALETHARRARGQLGTALGSFASVEWFDATDGDPAEAIREFAAGSGRRVLVLDLDWLSAPLRFDDAVLRRLDPAPWGDAKLDPPMESSEGLRRVRANRLGVLTSRPKPHNAKLTGDLRWIISAAHASVDAELAALLDSATATGAAVLLTATSASGTGERDAVGPGIGAGLDVAKVPVLWRVPGEEPHLDDAPRQWIEISAQWFRSGTDDDRFTWAAPGEGKSGWAAISELRWTTDRFTLLDTSSPPRPPRLYDRLLDPGEWYDRATEYPALADSLRSELLAQLYGKSPVIVFRAGDAPVDLALSVPVGGRRASRPSQVHLEPGESTRIQLPFGAATVRLGGRHQVWIGGEEFLIEALVVHSMAWRALLKEPQQGPGLTIWME